MSKVILVANRATNVPTLKDCDYIGIDKGSLYCMQKQQNMVCCIGDFDSINEDEKKQLQQYTELIELPKEKDVVDSEYAIRYAYEQGYTEICIYGVTGGRQDHFMGIYQLLKTGSIPFTIYDDDNIIYRLEKGEYIIPKRMTYLSFFACEPLCISVQGVKYPLSSRCIDESDLYLVSNEIVDQEAKLTIDGRLIVMETKS